MNQSEPTALGERLACPDCGLAQILPPPGGSRIAECARCGRVLAGAATGRVDVPLALTVSALILLLPATAAPLLRVWSYGAVRESRLYSGVGALWNDGFPSISALVAALSLLLPFVYLSLLVWVLASLHFGFKAPVGAAFRWVKHLRPWMMMDVFLVGGFVAYSRLNAIATVDVEFGGWCLIASTFAMLLALTQFDDRTVWESLPRAAPAAAGGNASRYDGIACTVCDLIDAAGVTRCVRCGAVLEHRKWESMQVTTALVIAGFLLYIPANTVPVLSLLRFGSADRNTIMSGVVELIKSNLWPLAAIVFTASIVLPLTKLCGLTWMLIATRRRSRHLLVPRTRFYRMIDLIGRWSNIDVFMGSVLLALLQFGQLTTLHAGEGLVAFAGVVIITMVATMTFDSRLMWDAAAVPPTVAS